jgi:cyclomaltodextrinase / maltogenic alpha-amylase / neopullulanase
MIAWARETIFYEVFVDRFARGRSTRQALPPWGSPPTRDEHMGGDLDGLRRRIPHLVDLGVNALYLTPIFQATTTHKYNASDYLAIDPRFGTDGEFDRLVVSLHANGIRLLLDGVFNHCGRGFFPFQDVLDNGPHSAFRNWFHIRSFPKHRHDALTYRSWRNCASLPVFNHDNPEVRTYLLEVVRHWLRRGVDGWRMDAVRDVPDKDLWRALRRAARRVQPEAFLLAELWGEGRAWLDGGRFDSLTNYSWRDVVLDFFVHRRTRVEEFVRALDRVQRPYTRSQQHALVNPLGSHDTERLFTLARGDVAAVNAAVFFQFVCPGLPIVYYGDEIGLEGGVDPDNRRAMEWRRASWNRRIFAHYQWMIRLRRSAPALVHGDWRLLAVLGAGNACVFLRTCAEQQALILVNNGDATADVVVKASHLRHRIDAAFVDPATKRSWPWQSDGTLRLRPVPRSCQILLRRL